MAKSKKKIDVLEAIGISLSSIDTETTSTAGNYTMLHLDKYPGKGKDLPPDFVKYFIPDPKHFAKKKKGKKNDWLNCQKETGQTFSHWLRRGPPMPFSRLKTIYLLPLSFNEDPIPKEIIDPLREYAEIFFQLEVKVLPPKYLKGKVPERVNDYSETYQVNASKVLDAMKPFIPSNAFCVAGITMCDLYPRDEWNFVFGLANMGGKSGVYSLARYLSNFGENQTSVYEPEREKERTATIIKRACKTMCHEIGHMFGMSHCIYFECIMNGSNHLEESDSRPMFLCPVCLRKLHFACKFDIQNRYEQMYQFWSSHGMKEEMDWVKERLDTLKM